MSGQYYDNDDIRLHGSKKFRIVFAAPAQVIAGTSYVPIYTYSGSGLFHGVLVDANQDGFQLQVTIDATEILVSDVSGSQLNSIGLLSSTNIGGNIFVRLAAGVVAFFPPYPIPFDASVQVAGKRDSGGNVTVSNYLAYLDKET